MKRHSLIFAALALPLSAQLRITEVMSDSNHSAPNAGGDWFEITNSGSTDVNLSGYSFDDDDGIPGASGDFPTYSLTPGTSVIVLDDTSSVRFKALWDLDAAVRVITNSELSNFQGLGKNGDALYLFNNSGKLASSFTFGAATEGFSFARFTDGSPVPGTLSSNGNFGAYESDDPSEDVGSPGIAQDLPEPLPPFFSALFNTAVIAGSSLNVSEFRINTIDPNPDDVITITSSERPAWLTVINLGNGLASLSGTPSASDIGSHDFTVIATDNTSRSANQSYRINVLPASPPVILNEYNAVEPREFLDGGGQNDPGAPTDPRLGRIKGNGGAWVEFVITGDPASPADPVDLRGWTLKIESNDHSRTLKLSDHVALSAIAPGTILTLTESRGTSPTRFNITSNLNTTGIAWSNIWMHDNILIDQANSTHPAAPAINSDNTRFTWLNSSDALIYGPSGESIALKDANNNGIGDALVSVGGTEVFKLEISPASSITPLNINHDDGTSSTYGAPNRWSNNTMVQNFSTYGTLNTPPSFGPIPLTKAARGSYSTSINVTPGSTLNEILVPDFLDVSLAGGAVTIVSNRPLTTADIGAFEITIEADNGAPSNNLGYLAYELEVLNPAPLVVLNEYNAVAPDRFLNGGTAGADEDGAPASIDSHFGRSLGNGGNWFELAVVGDGGSGYVNLTDWTIEVGKIAPSGLFDSETIITLSDQIIWSSIAHGTLLTFIDKNTAAGGLDTEFNRVNNLTTEGWAWINVYLGTPGIITVGNPTDLKTDSNNTAFVIKNATGTVIFGPVGEGVAPLGGVGSEEILELETDASPMISSIDDASDTVLGYDDGSSGSTFGAPNLFSPLGAATDRAQDFSLFVQSQLETYLAANNLPGADPTHDADNDGSSNLDEYLLGGDPSNAAIFPLTSYDPSTGIASANVRTDDPNYVLITQRSSNLQNWVSDSLDKVDEASPLGPEFALRKFTYTGDEPSMFFRVSTQSQD